MTTMNNNNNSNNNNNNVNNANNVNQQAATNQQSKEYVGSIPADTRIEFEAEPFKTMAHIERTNTKNLSILIKEKFKTYFHDLKGVYIQYQNNNTFVTSFIFEYNSAEPTDGRIRNLVPYTHKSNSKYSSGDLFDANNQLQKRFSGKTYELTPETKLLLAPFMYGDKNQNNYKSKIWNDRIKEIKENSNARSPWMFNNAAERVYVVVNGIDIRKVLRAVYGDTMVVKTIIDKDGFGENIMSDAFYSIKFSRFLPGPDGIAVVNIEQVDKVQVQEFINEESPRMAYNTTGFKYW